MSKFIFVSGGVCSSLGKGIAASSIGALLESRGLNVRMIKCDPYINVDAGTMNLHQHGEIYVTDDGAETDMDLGNYARFTRGHLSQANSITTGQIYEAVIRKERNGEYQGQCVQVIPHITDELKSRILSVAKKDDDTDVVIIEIGGTIGDIESIPFFEVARQMIHEREKKNAISVHLTLIPQVTDGELKTKPTQHSVKKMLETGIQPDILICRSPVMLDEETRGKIALFTNVGLDAVFTSPDIDIVYQIPIVFFDQKLDEVILRKMGIEYNAGCAGVQTWYSMMKRYSARQGKVRIGIVGQDTKILAAYTSLREALFHAGLEHDIEVILENIDSFSLEGDKNADMVLGKNGFDVDGILIPGGFDRYETSSQNGINGMIKAAVWARENKKPYLGICLGMHIMAIDWARNILNWSDAGSVEFSPDTKHPVVSHLEGHADQSIKNGGDSIRLGANQIINKDGSHVMAAYGEECITERHRHRYKLSNKYQEEMINSGLKFTAFSPDGSFIECIEWPGSDHPWGVGVQFHPEYKSSLMAASPLFRDFVDIVKKEKMRV